MIHIEFIPCLQIQTLGSIIAPQTKPNIQVQSSVFVSTRKLLSGEMMIMIKKTRSLSVRVRSRIRHGVPPPDVIPAYRTFASGSRRSDGGEVGEVMSFIGGEKPPRAAAGRAVCHLFGESYLDSNRTKEHGRAVLRWCVYSLTPPGML